MPELAQPSTTARLGPGGPPSLSKRCQTGLSDVGAKKSHSAPKAAKASLLHASLVTRRQASARGLTGVAMAAS